MEGKETVNQLLDFIENSPSPFHAIANMKQGLDKAGYEQLLEGEEWELKKGGKYYVIRNQSSIIAFRIPMDGYLGFQIMASHSDSPGFKIKENPEMDVDGHYVKLNIEKYGGMLCAPWMDRPLSVAGRLIVKEGECLKTKLIDVDRDFCMIPNLAIHMNRKANEELGCNAQKDMLPLYGCESAKGRFMEQIAKAAGVVKENIVGKDLFLYNRMKGSIWGAEEEFLSIGRLDDLECAFASWKAFLEAEDGNSIPVHCVFDNEEVGSETKQGAGSTFLLDTLMRINENLGGTESKYRQLLASSFMLSADNAHAVHPNQPDKTCPTNRTYLNGGIVVKYSANQKYTTDGMSAAVFAQICEKAGVPCQTFFNRSDMLGGSTLGNISGTQVSLQTVDIGLPQLAMHSPYETGGVKDIEYLVQAAKIFFQASVVEIGDGTYQVKWNK